MEMKALFKESLMRFSAGRSLLELWRESRAITATVCPRAGLGMLPPDSGCPSMAKAPGCGR
jgi:hypothetical protein